MSAGVWFWIIYVVVALFGCFQSRRVFKSPDGSLSYGPFGIGLVALILIGLIGWRVFGPPLQ